MSDINKTNNPPLLRSAELKLDALLAMQAQGIDPSKIANAVELEGDVLLLKFLNEEMLGLMDEIKVHSTYDGILESEFFEEENMPVPREKLQELLAQTDRFKDLLIQKYFELQDLTGEERGVALEKAIEIYTNAGFDESILLSYFNSESGTDPGNYRLQQVIRVKCEQDLSVVLSEHGIEESDIEKVKRRFAIMQNQKERAPSKDVLSADLRELMREDWKIVSDIVVRNMYEINKAFYSQKSTVSKKKSHNEAIAKTQGQRRLMNILIKKYLKLDKRTQAILAEGGKEKVAIFVKSIWEKIKKVLRNLETIKGGVNAAKAGKMVAGLYTSDEVAGVFDLTAEEVSEIDDHEDEQDEKYLEKKKPKLAGEKRKGARELHDDLGNLVNTDALTAYVNYIRELRHLHSMMNGGTIVETDYVKGVIAEAMPNLTKNPPTVVYLHGDYGTGKTAIAVHIARTRFKKEPLIVSGNKFVEPDRFTEELKIERMDPTAFINEQLKELGSEERFTEGEKLGDMIGVIVGEKSKIVDKIAEARKSAQKVDKLDNQQMEEIRKMVDDTFENQVQGRYVLGAMYLAMKEGRPLIIDEANAITPEVMIAFNDLMTKKIGDKVKTRSDEKEITVKEGYCVIWTGNTGGRYKNARYNDVDPASFSRLAPIKVQYLPQTLYKGDLSDTFEERLKLDKLSDKFMDENRDIAGLKLGSLDRVKEIAKTDQIFQVLLVKLLNRRLGARLLVKKDDPYSVFKDLYRLSAGARVIMNIFEGTIEPGDLPKSHELKRWIGSDTGADLMSKLRKTNLTMRGLLDKIVAAYLNDNMAMDIEFYVFKFVKELASMPEEMAIVYTIMKQYGFFMGEGWKEVNTSVNIKDFEDKLTKFAILSLPKYEKVDINGDYVSLLKPKGDGGDYESRYFSSLETLQLMFGFLPPRKVAEYKEMADIIDQEESKKNALRGESEKEGAMEEQVRVAFERIKYAFDPEKFMAGESLEKSDDSSDEIEKIERKIEISQKIREFNEEMKALKLNDKEHMSTLTYSEYLEVAGKFCDMVIGVMEAALVISEEEANTAREGSVEERVNMVAALVDKVNNAA